MGVNIFERRIRKWKKIYMVRSAHTYTRIGIHWQRSFRFNRLVYAFTQYGSIRCFIANWISKITSLPSPPVTEATRYGTCINLVTLMRVKSFHTQWLSPEEKNPKLVHEIRFFWLCYAMHLRKKKKQKNYSYNKIRHWECACVWVNEARKHRKTHHKYLVRSKKVKTVIG